MIDLHMHSRFSDDGEFTPEELVKMCAQKGIETMSITDHNCVKANLEAESLATAKGIRYVPGVEIDCTYKGLNFHVLGYGIDYKSKDFEKIESNIEDQMFQISLEQLEKTQSLGFRITEADLWELSKDNYHKGCWTGEMFAEILLNKPEYKDHPFLKPYRPGEPRGGQPYVNFYWDFYAQEKPCYVPMQYPAMEEILDIIHRNHGVAVLAHPGVNLKDHMDLLDEILDLGFDGIEAYSSYHSRIVADFFNKKAENRHLFTTSGSDFHGKNKPAIAIGQHHN